MYREYIKYILEHKKNVFIECMKASKKHWNQKYDGHRTIAMELFVHAFTHDLSKFSHREFKPYAEFFHGKYGVKCEDKGMATIDARSMCKAKFDMAWKYHYKVNKHHPEHWIGKEMPMKYIRFMVCDLKAMSRKFGGSAQEYYLKNYYSWDITKETRYNLEVELDLINEYNYPISECDEEYWMTIDELIKDAERFLDNEGYISFGSVKNALNYLLQPACNKYKLDIYDLIKGSVV